MFSYRNPARVNFEPSEILQPFTSADSRIIAAAAAVAPLRVQPIQYSSAMNLNLDDVAPTH
jgi:hypothetical protein